MVQDRLQRKLLVRDNFVRRTDELDVLSNRDRRNRQASGASGLQYIGTILLVLVATTFISTLHGRPSLTRSLVLYRLKLEGERTCYTFSLSTKSYSLQPRTIAPINGHVSYTSIGSSMTSSQCGARGLHIVSRPGEGKCKFRIIR